MTTNRFDGLVAVVTGASGRLGRLVTEAFEREGARVAAFVHRAPEDRPVPGAGESRVRPYTCDATDADSVTAAFDAVASDFGRVDMLVHTVGGWALSPLLETAPGEWERIVRLNLFSTVLCFRAAARIMAMGNGGGLVAIASSQGADRGVGGQSAYSAGKAGVIRLVESVADEFSDRGVTARAVVPSTILYGTDTGEGVRAEVVVRLCLDCAVPNGPVPSGGLVRAYGSAGRSV